MIILREDPWLMPLVHPCKTDGCEVLTMGDYCLDCEHDLEVVFFGRSHALSHRRRNALPDELPRPLRRSPVSAEWRRI
jgi:hypothetical protein